MSRICASCGSENGVLLCGRCKSVGYCSQECQKADWIKGHKGACVKGQNKLAGTPYVAFPPEGPDRVGADQFRSYDNDICLGKKGPSTDSLVFISDKKYGKAAKGKINVFFFWGQYHKPGYKFIPFYSVLQAKYKGKVQFTGVSMDPTVDYPQKFLDDPNKKYSAVFRTEFAMAHDNGMKLKSHFAEMLPGTLSPPHSFVVDAKGTIVWHQDHSELGATAPTYMNIMEKQLDALVAGKALEKVGDRVYEEDEEDEGDGDMDGGDFELF